MDYNFIKKIRDYEFWENNLNQAVENINSILLRLSPVYRAIGLEKLVKSSERILGQLDNLSRAQVETAYATATVLLAMGVMADKPGARAGYMVTSAALYALGLLHHDAVREDRNNGSDLVNR